MGKIIRPKWQHDINQYLNLEKIICLNGNVYDKCISFNDEKGYCTVSDFLKDLLVKKGYAEENIKYFDPILGCADCTGDYELTSLTNKRSRRRPVEVLADAITKDFTQKNGQPIAYIVPNASFFNVDNASISSEENDAWVKIRIAGQQNQNDSKIVFLFNSFSDIPTSLTKGQFFIKIIDISMPDQTQRTQFTSAVFPEYSLEAATYVSDASDKLTLERLEAIFKDVCRKNPRPEAKQLIEAIETYFSGYSDNPWRNIPKEKLDNLENYLNKHIKGQEVVIHQVVKQIRSICNGTADKLKNSKYAPKGLFFFPGTTGVGKTELCKLIATYILGDESNMITIRCNELKEAHNGQRLIGAPSGYVGYENGGELTNAVREHPFSIVLFDEIEKSHPNVWDYLMTAISDGRLTDGRGQLCTFGNTLIVFTTNLGATEASEEVDNEKAKEKILQAIESYYKDEINRMEVFGRIKNGIIPFNKIDEKTAKEISKIKLEDFKRNYEKDGTKLVFSDEIENWAIETCSKSIKYGGRDVSTAVENSFVTGLSDIADHNDIDGATVYIDSVKSQSNGDTLFNYRVVVGKKQEGASEETVDRIVESTNNTIINNKTEVTHRRRFPNSDLNNIGNIGNPTDSETVMNFGRRRIFG